MNGIGSPICSGILINCTFSSYIYLRQVNEVNGGDNVFVLCGSVCVHVYVRSGPVNLTSLKWELNANSSKTVKDTDFKFDAHDYRDSSDKTP